MQLDRSLIHFGNHKLPNTTAIFNICSGTDCPSRKLGLCQVINSGYKCYAIRDEHFRPGPLAYRRRQEKLWDALTAADFAFDFMTLVGRRRLPTLALRLNESGDFRGQGDIEKAADIAQRLRHYGIVTYCYTARSDLDFSDIGPLVVNGSGFKVTGEFRFVPTKKDRPKGYRTCPGSCKTCSRCQKGKLTVVLPH